MVTLTPLVRVPGHEFSARACVLRRFLWIPTRLEHLAGPVFSGILLGPRECWARTV